MHAIIAILTFYREVYEANISTIGHILRFIEVLFTAINFGLFIKCLNFITSFILYYDDFH